MQRLVLFLVLMTMLFGVFAAPDQAHANDIDVDHAAAHSAVHQQVEPSGDGEGEENSSPCHAVVHHHCSIAISSENSADALLLPVRSGQLKPFDYRALASLSSVPPTQPPSA